MNLPKSVKIVEVGPRDGLQNESKIISTENKIQFINLLSESDLKNIEVSSFVNPKLIPQLSDAKEVFTSIKKNKNITYSVLVPNLKGLERAIESGVQRIAIFTAASEVFNKKNINMTIEESINNYKDVVEKALKNNISVRGYISTCFVCPYEGKIKKEKVLEIGKKLLDIGVDEISFGDTIGSASPLDVYDTLSCLLTKIPKDKIALHLHDTYRMALSNVLVGLQLGVFIFDSSSGGLGGCPFAQGASGNLATEDLVFFLNKMNIKTNVDIKKIIQASEFIHEKLGKSQPNKYKLFG